MAVSIVANVEYRDIPGFEGYRAGSDGTIWSQWKRGAVKGCFGGGSASRLGSKWVLLKGRPHSKSGHIEVQLCHGPKGKRHYKAHQLVLFAFVGPMPEGMECRHLNGNPSDNRADNLKWGTRKENIHDAMRHGKFYGNIMKYNLARATATLLLLFSPLSAEVKVTGPSGPVPVNAPAFINVTGAKLGDPFTIFVVPEGGQFVELYDTKGTPVGIYTNSVPGIYTACVVVYNAETKAQEKSTFAIHVGVGPTPPIPPGPIPPGPTPIPPQPAGFRVLILEETAQRGSLPKTQLSALLSTKARDYMNAKAPKGPDGKTPEWRMLDDDHTDESFLAENWRKSLDMARKDSAGKLPWIIVSDGAKGESRAFPQTEAELLELLRKYGG